MFAMLCSNPQATNAVMGKIILEKELKTIPENPMMDDKGILMQMVYAE